MIEKGGGQKGKPLIKNGERKRKQSMEMKIGETVKILIEGGRQTGLQSIDKRWQKDTINIQCKW